MSITKDCDDKWTESDALHKATLFFRLLNHARALEAMLKKQEWDISEIDGERYCPECYERHNHSPDCQLAKLLEGVEDSHK